MVAEASLQDAGALLCVCVPGNSFPLLSDSLGISHASS